MQTEDRLAFSQKKRRAVKHERRDGKRNFILRGGLGLGVYGLGLVGILVPIPKTKDPGYN